MIRYDKMILQAVNTWRVASLVCHMKPNMKSNEKMNENKPMSMISPVKSNPWRQSAVPAISLGYSGGTCGKSRFWACRNQLPRDAMHKRGICCHPVSVRLSVRPSRSWVAPKRINISSNFFSPSGSHTILVFPYKTGWRCSYSSRLVINSHNISCVFRLHIWCNMSHVRKTLYCSIMDHWWVKG